MNIRTWAGIVVLLGTLAGSVRAAEPADAQSGPAESPDLRNLRSMEDQLAEMAAQRGSFYPEVVSLRDQIDTLRKQLLARAEMRCNRARQELDDINQELRNAQDNLRGITGRTDVSPDSREAAVESLEKDKEELMLENAAAEARRNAIEEAV